MDSESSNTTHFYASRMFESNFSSDNLEASVTAKGKEFLNGEILKEIGRLVNSQQIGSLSILDLSSNSLQGMVPYSMGNLQFLENFDLCWNKLQGTKLAFPPPLTPRAPLWRRRFSKPYENFAQRFPALVIGLGNSTPRLTRFYHPDPNHTQKNSLILA
ncbi:Leucine-rich repeat domain superfamily [Forsythia ovata]|uniref:Leucine-rich repeat domain superfamily n=1 Tax=Forsythia ovata TaxID=205694 RepID=A0ABD1UWM3_9LAMI